MKIIRSHFFYFLLFIFIYFFLEIICYFVLKKLTPHGIYPSIKLINQDIEAYNKSKNLNLGWLSKTVDKDEYGGRKVKNSSLYNSICFEVYGDSYTESVDVDYENSWPSLLSKKLNCRVLNFGVQGYGTDQSFIRYMNNNKKANIVAINHFSENVVRNINQFRNLLYPTENIMLKPRFILNKNKIKLVETPKIYNLNKNDIFKELKNEYFLPGDETGIIDNINYSYIYNLYKILTNHHKFKAFFKNEPHSKQFYNINHQSKALEITSQILFDFHNFAVNRNQIAIITIIPHCKDFDYYKKNNKIPYQNLIDKLNLQNIFFIDFLPKIFEKYPNYKNLYTKKCKGQHFNHVGNKVLSEIFHEFLKENKIF